MRGWFWVIATVFLLSMDIASAAKIYGNVYDFNLDQAKNAEVMINTTPEQTVIAKDSSYSFEVSSGDYLIEARQYSKGYVSAYTNDNITIKQNGNYVIDLILFPEIETGGEDSYPIDVNEGFFDSENNNFIWILALVVIVAGGVHYYFAHKKPKKDAKEEEGHAETEDADLETIVKIIKKEGGRATQKDIRKQIPLSEAKISLMIADLEHKGVVEKIKKGRGNIVILKK